MNHPILLTVLLSVAAASTVKAQDSHNHAGHTHAMPGQTVAAQASPPTAGPRGGALKQIGGVQVETLVSQGGIQMFVYDRSGQAVAVDRGRGAASLRVEGNAKRYRYDLLPDGKGGLAAPVNLAAIAGRQIEVDIQLVGIPAAGGQTLMLNEVATVPASELQLAAAAIARQKICPVSGQPLGSMGDPVAVNVSGQRVFVCCAGCVDAVQSNPAKYAAGRPQIAVASATDADADAIARQELCPVMDEPLGSMGTPIKVTVGDKPVYLCCKGCIKKVQAEPAKYLAMVYGNQKDRVGTGSAEVAASKAAIAVTAATPADTSLIAEQKICPVMDEPLGSMGNPIKVMVGDKPVFVCCKGCIKRVTADPAKYLALVDRDQVGSAGAASGGVGGTEKTVPAGTEQVRDGVFKVSPADAPFIAAQKICPVMDEPLDAMGGPYKVHAAGKAIYICCPGCAKRIAAEPQAWLAALAQNGVDAPTLR